MPEATALSFITGPEEVHSNVTVEGSEESEVLGTTFPSIGTGRRTGHRAILTARARTVKE
jgi:hypothetical protein